MDQGERIGRFVIFRDIDGRRHAVALNAPAALCESEDGSVILLLPAGRLIQLELEFERVLEMLSH